MFGHQSNDDIAKATPGAPPTVSPSPHQPTTIAPSHLQTAPAPSVAPAAVTASAPVTPTPPTPPVSSDGFILADAPGSTPAPNAPAPTAPPANLPSPAQPAASPAATSDLVELKQSALHELSPLIGHLDQSPEEKFRTTMMMIQASDDQTLLPTALSAAKQITDEKARAQALLDVVNEINYFTQQHEA